MQQPIQPGPAPKKKKSSNGCLIALAIVGGLVVAFVAVAGFGIYRFANTKEGKMVFGAIGDATRLAAEAQNAPGAKEVRALGCDQAMAFDMEKMGKLMDRFDASAPPSGTVMVVCQMNVFGGKEPSCNDVAHTYLAAAGPPARELLVAVRRQGGHNACSGVYDPKGTKIRDLPMGAGSHLPWDK